MSHSLAQQLSAQLTEVMRRGQTFQRRWLLAVVWLVIAAGVWGAWRAEFLRQPGPVLAAYGTAVAVVCTLLVGPWSRKGWSRLETARRIEAHFPDLNAALVTALEQSPDVVTGRLNVLQHQVLVQALTHAVTHPWNSIVPTRRLVGATVAAGLSAVLLTGVLWTAWNSGQAPTSLAEWLPGTSASPVEVAVRVEPGDVELERGSSLLVLARFQEPAPQRVQLVTTVDGEPPTAISCERSLDDPLFGARLSPVLRDLTYYVTFDGQQSPTYRVTVYDLPALEHSELLITPPSYTGHTEQRLENALTTAVIEGSQVTITCRVNKPLVSAALVSQSAERLSLRATDGDTRLWSVSLAPRESVRWRLELTDDRGRQNRDPEEFRIEVLPNRPPHIEIAFPGRDVRVSPLEELTVEGRVTDDLGLIEVGVVWEIAGREPVTQTFPLSQVPTLSHAVQWLQALEELQVEPDDLLAYHVYAVDRGPDGQPRRTVSDLFFAEVRPFEETFRQMDSPAGGGQSASQSGGQPQGNRFNQLIEVQKQIVAGTFNLTRQPSGWTEKTQADVQVLRTSQDQLRDKLLNMIPEMQAVTTQRLAGNAAERMEVAVEHFDEVLEQSDPVRLSSALSAAQEAYQALLKLRAREHRVMQGQQAGGGSSGGASPAEQQLQELELTNKQNRYQTRQTAASEPLTPQQEDLGILDRLRELARRQADLAEKLRELEAARRTATSEAERREIERQLKRLRDEQQQLLQDADELRTRLAQSQRQEQLAPTRQQLESTRERLLEATERLREGQLGQALSSATRAERDLQQMQQAFRQQTSARFADALRSLREESRQLTQREQELREKLQASDTSPKPSLRQSRERADLEHDFREQQQALQSVLQQARQLVQDAESSEPLLSQQLYETLRGTRETKLEQALESVPQLLKHGFLPEAVRAEQQVQQGLERLQSGIEKAAEAVLGNEVEALKRAKAELAELSQQLQQEFERQQRQSSDGTGAAGAATAPTPTEQGPQGAASESTNKSESSNQQQNDSTEGASSSRGESSSPGTPENNRSGQPTSSRAGSGSRPAEATSSSPASPTGSEPGTPGASEGGPADQPSAAGGAAGRQPQERPSSSSRPGGLRGGEGRTVRQNGSTGGQEWGGFNSSGGGGNAGPLTGEGYREWSERLRDVETMVSDPQIQAEVARLREQARSLRADFKRHSLAPTWELVKGTLYEPLVQLQQKLAEEVARRESPEALVPIDRDPIPARYRELVRSYYERLAKEGENLRKTPVPESRGQ